MKLKQIMLGLVTSVISLTCAMPVFAKDNLAYLDINSVNVIENNGLIVFHDENSSNLESITFKQTTGGIETLNLNNIVDQAIYINNEDIIISKDTSMVINKDLTLDTTNHNKFKDSDNADTRQIYTFDWTIPSNSLAYGEHIMSTLPGDIVSFEINFGPGEFLLGVYDHNNNTFVPVWYFEAFEPAKFEDSLIFYVPGEFSFAIQNLSSWSNTFTGYYYVV